MLTRIASPLKFVQQFINQGQSRSIKAKKNIITSFLIKGVSISISLVLVPLTINYINPSRYGIWLTLSSIVGWFSFFDIGLTHGLRNKYAEAKANNDDSSVQMYISTTYAVLTIIFVSLWLIFLIINGFLDWASILKVPQDMKHEVSLLAMIVFTYFCAQFILRVVTTIAIADQQSAKSAMIDVLGQIISLIVIVVLVKTTKGSLINLGLALCLSPLLALISANILFFKGKYEKYRPKFSKINFSYAKGLFNLGLTFFIIQIAAVIQFESANIIIARNFGTSEVTSYNIVYKYFGMVTMLFTIFLTPFWSASTEAYAQRDFSWIKSSMKKYNLLNVLLFAVSLLMLVFSNYIYSLWLGKGKVDIGFWLSFWGFVYVSFTIFGSKYVNFLNGISALRLQFWTSIFSPVIYIAVAVLLIKYFKAGVASLFIASIIANLYGIIMAPIQYYQIIVKNKKGIWTK
ncbi:polysaccharide biosynthesis protein [Mucilaginibacter conchicola]|uniref:Polysaccharide biosynthesis protein n=1 Tax=Mucilaginibacter conchicola TaxID=2303333 RepID=A0A372NY67_9SPHI|nr:oligosaccharide flippase family protein [Mucilaginibacter conchicola]RFZ94844.1 polysaccharide biosynthesis protein [Mucilaginibacter conchicola]